MISRQIRVGRAVTRRLGRFFVVLLLIAGLVTIGSESVLAATLNSGSTSLSTAVTSGTSVSYTIDVSNVTLSAVKCIALTFSTAIGGTTLPTGMDISGATYNAAGSDFVPDAQTWSAAVTGATVKVTNVTGETPASASARTILLTGITNGSTAGTTYYAEVNTYNNTDCSSSAVDTDGISTFAFADAVTVSATVNPTLTFTISATTCSLGTLSASATNSCTFTIAAATNGTAGYTVSYPSSEGTLTSATDGSDTITAIGSTAAAASTGSEQFGINLKDNATPNVGVEPSGGSGAAASNYGTADSFAWDGTTGRTIASVAGPSAATTYTVSTIANISSTTEAGAYTRTMHFLITSNY